MYKLSFFVPEADLEPVKEAVFAAGAGQFENYQHCCWQVLGQGQFRPMQGSQPHIGEQQKLTQLEEWRVEMICTDKKIKGVIKALKLAHPYEEVAYDVIRLEAL